MTYNWLLAARLLKEKTAATERNKAGLTGSSSDDGSSPRAETSGDQSPSSSRSGSRSRRLDQMRRQKSMDSGAPSMDGGSAAVIARPQVTAAVMKASPTSPQASRARLQAERNWHLAFSLHEVEKLQDDNAGLKRALALAQGKAAPTGDVMGDFRLGGEGSAGEPEEIGGDDDGEDGGGEGSGLTAATAAVRAEVRATAADQDRVMAKLRWIEQALLRKTLQEGGEPSEALPPPPPPAPALHTYASSMETGGSLARVEALDFQGNEPDEESTES